MSPIVVLGAGLAGLSAAIEAAENGYEVTVVSPKPSERAQSVMAEGGMNAALGEGDSPKRHFEDTIKAGRFLADPEAVMGMANAAPGIARRLRSLGTMFNIRGDEMDLRAFGGQKTRRTVFAQSSTGKQIMSAVIQEARKYEFKGLIRRLSRHALSGLLLSGNGCTGCEVQDVYTGESLSLAGSVIAALGGMNGLFNRYTGSQDNTGAATAILFQSGASLANGEFIQYHPTTAAIPGKRILISEAARSEGGRLFCLKNGKPFYFMEEKDPELKNLAPRDVITREMAFLGEQAYLDLTPISNDAFRTRLSGTLEDCLTYLRLDPRKKPIPVEPGIHYFMGGLLVDIRHQTNVPGLYAAGECCYQYHGANRLGGNSLLGAIYGGIIAARSAMADGCPTGRGKVAFVQETQPTQDRLAMQNAMSSGLGPIRDKAGLERLVNTLERLDKSVPLLAKAIAISALNRKESRGAHCRSDFPNENSEIKNSVASANGREVLFSAREAANYGVHA
ncbi:MAG: FAD-binding protein [Clostridiales bacterium]|nr:FAD-binding protein [Clostridiales bacterium]